MSEPACRRSRTVRNDVTDRLRLLHPKCGNFRRSKDYPRIKAIHRLAPTSRWALTMPLPMKHKVITCDLVLSSNTCESSVHPQTWWPPVSAKLS